MAAAKQAATAAGALSLSSAAGNRFQIWDGFVAEPPTDPSAEAVRFCESGQNDGLLLVLPVSDQSADCQMVLYNADGGRAETCGNGLRCVGKLMFEAGRFDAGSTLRVLTDVGVVAVEVILFGKDQLVRRARVQFPLSPETRPLVLEDEQHATSQPVRFETIQATYVDLGNPHCVIFGDSSSLKHVKTVGSILEHHSAFPHRANIEFAHVVRNAADTIRVRVWERGVGETEACGSGAVAVAFAAVEQGLANWPATIQMRGGDLSIDRDERGLWLEGPVDLRL